MDIILHKINFLIYHINSLIDEISNLQLTINNLLNDNAENLSRHNFYTQQNKEHAKNLEDLRSHKSCISGYLEVLGLLKQPITDSLNVSNPLKLDLNVEEHKAIHEKLENDYLKITKNYKEIKEEFWPTTKKNCEKLLAFAAIDFKIMRVFPIKKEDWKQKNQGKEEEGLEKYQLLTSSRISAAKIKLLNVIEDVTNILASALEASFKLVKDLDYIDLSDNELEDTTVQLLVDAIKGEQGYESLPLYQCEVIILSYNSFSKNGLECLLDALTKQPKLKRHILLNNNLIDFDLLFFKKIVLEQSKQAQLVNLDLTMNFIPKGFMFEEVKSRPVRLYYRKDRMNTKLTAKRYSLESRVEIKTFFANRQKDYCFLRSLSAVGEPGVNSLVASLDEANKEPEIDFNFGVIGLFALKTPIPGWNEHAFLVVEGISKFGQRYLIRGDLYVNSNGEIQINVCQCSPQDFFHFTKNGKRVFCRTGTFKREKIKLVLEKLCNCHMEQSFFNYSLLPNGEDGTHNCLTWAATILSQVLSIDINCYSPSIPSITVGRGIFQSSPL